VCEVLERAWSEHAFDQRQTLGPTTSNRATSAP
jgi:hypothetical protein